MTDAPQYEWLDNREAILKRPDTHVGSVVPRDVERAVLGADGAAKVVKALVSPAFEKTFDEVFTNALDHAMRDASMRVLEVHLNQATGVFHVKNDGATTIPTGNWSPDVAIPIPQVLFHELNSGSNFDDARKEMVGGRNGVGAKVSNYMSRWFRVSIQNAAEQMTYAQRFADNGAVVHPPQRSRYTKKTSWVEISWLPDYARLGMSLPLDDAVRDFVLGRVVDGAACTTKKINVSFNGAHVPLKGLKQYVERFGGAPIDSLSTWAKEDDVASPGMQLVVTEAPGGREPVRVCLVNGVRCKGQLLDAVERELCHKVLGQKPPKAKEDILASCVDLFVVARMKSPQFDAQSKSFLETPSKDWGFAVPSLDKAANKVLKLDGFVQSMEALALRLDSKLVAKAQKSTGARTANIPKYERALQVGKKACTLFLTEGDSAKGTVVAGFSVVGRDTNGVFPLRGKLVNTFDMKPSEALKNAEIANLVAILGLDVTKEYDAAAVKKLPYKRLMIVTDMDVDGSHITGLVLAFFAHFVPSLLKVAPDFVGRLATPLIKAQLRGATHEFHSQLAFDGWVATGARPTSVRYYKGLGTSTNAEAKDYFRKLQQNSCVLDLDAGAREALHLMFAKTEAAGRKDLLKSAAPGEVDYAQDRVPITHFVHTELVTYGRYSMKRAIPSAVDGLKPSQRKILHVVRKLKGDKPHKVAQLAADVAKETSYHHGEVSLAAAIIGMAQEWVGANQVALLRPDGNFGTRHGTTAASPRYVFTRASDKARELFRGEDDAVLNLLEDEGQVIEPDFFVPILPMLLVNGCTGIATAWSTNVYTHSVDAVAERCLVLAENGIDAALPPLYPTFPGFTGATEVVDGGAAVVCTAAVRVAQIKSLHITDLPPGMATYDVIAKLQAKDDVKEVLNRSLDDAVDVLVEFKEKVPDDPVQALKLSTKLSLKNMHAFDADDTLVRYESANDIVKAHAAVRLSAYEKRFAHQIEEMMAAIGKLEERRRVVQLALTSQPWSKTRAALVDELGEADASAVRKLTLDDVTEDAAKELEAKVDALKTKIEKVGALTPGGVWADEIRAYFATFAAQKRERE